jgi:hypothetical protein
VLFTNMVVGIVQAGIKHFSMVSIATQGFCNSQPNGMPNP